MLTEMKMIPHSHFGMSGTIQRHTLIYTVVIASILAVFFDLGRIASLGAFFYLVMDMVVHWGVYRFRRKEIGAIAPVLLMALAFDAVVLGTFTAIKLGVTRRLSLTLSAPLSRYSPSSGITFQAGWHKFTKQGTDCTYPTVLSTQRRIPGIVTLAKVSILFIATSLEILCNRQPFVRQVRMARELEVSMILNSDRLWLSSPKVGPNGSLPFNLDKAALDHELIL